MLAFACLLWIFFAQSASAASQTFSFTGAEQTFKVPAGVHSLHVVAIGAKGGKGSDASPEFGGAAGFGDRLEADLAATPNQVLFIEVGGTGADGAAVAGGGGGGFNGGGSSNNGSFNLPGGGGGGATDIRTCSRLAASCAGVPNTLSSRLLVAGGGGGGGSLGRWAQLSGGEGGDAGKSGQTGQSICSTGDTPGGGGGAGTQTAGGAGGVAGNGGAPAGNPGAFGQGGAAGTGGTNSEPGGGGGGGYFGGGAGGGANGRAAGGGGGGSSFANAAATSNVSTITTDATGSPRLLITPGPSNAFSFGSLKRNKHKGTATLPINVPGPGRLDLTGKSVKTQRPASGAVASKAVTAAGIVKLLVKARGKAKRKLNKTGKVKVKINVTFTPTGGSPNTQSKRIKLIKKH